MCFIQGVYVLEDNKFRLLQRLSGSADENINAEAAKILIIPSGIIRGAMSNLGLSCTVKAEINNAPHCKSLNESSLVIRYVAH